jgi:hypothetical protein
LTVQQEQVSGKPSLTEAICYALRHWDRLVLFLDPVQTQEVYIKIHRTLLAKSLQGDKRNLYSALWLCLSG